MLEVFTPSFLCVESTLSTINQLPEFIAFAAEQNINIICVKEHSELDLKYHDPGSGWIFVSASTWKNSINITIRDVEMFLSHSVLKPLNSIENIQPKMMCAHQSSQQYQ